MPVVLRVSAVLALAGAIAASVAGTGSAKSAKIVDRTYPCVVRPDRYVDLDLNVDLPPDNGMQRPAQAEIFTTTKTIKRNGIDFNVPQVVFEHTRNSLHTDTTNCHKSRKKVALVPAGLGSPETVTTTYLGEFQQRCATAKHVLVRFRITMQHGTPQSALFAVRNDDKKRHPVALFDWRPRKIKGWLGDCVKLG
jgi:hypothetical protein